MSGPFGSQQWMYSTGFYPYKIDQSLRFNDDDSAYLTRTPASSSNRKTWTWSGWVKASEIDSGHDHLFSATSDYNNGSLIRVNNDRTFQYLHFDNNSAVINKKTSALIRDSSAWYHFVVVYDSDNSTAEDRVKLYINGVRQTSFKTNTNPSSGKESDFNLASRSNFIGLNSDNTNLDPFDGYMAEVNFIDGQALDATDFGETKSGVWIPKSYSGSYGTNGFYLDFGNSGSLGADSSGNGNNFTPTNLAATDQVPDSPTNNFATWSPLDRLGGSMTLSEGDLKVVCSGGSGRSAYSSTYMSSGSWYIECTGVANSIQIGGVNGSPYFRYQSGSYNNNGTTISGKDTFTASDILAVAYNADDQTIEFFKNNVSQGSTTFTAATDVDVNFAVNGTFSQTDTIIANFGQDSSFAGNKTAQGNTDANGIGDFYYEPPSGFLALCSANLPDPAIDPARDDVPADYFNTVLYTGNGSTQSITGVGFQPDFIWLKSRSQGYDHGLVDAVRGVTKFLESNTTDAEATAANFTTSFDSDGFSLGVNNRFNQSSATNVAWNWKADGSGVSNTDGSITSTVSANTDAGFSIVTFTTDGTNTTVGTGLSSSAPLDMVIIKRRDSTSEWQVGHRFSGQGSNFAYHLELNSTAALSGSGPYFMGSQATSNGDRIYLGAGTSGVSSATWVAYCFQSVEGFSKFGSYTGNGSADGPFVYTGFRPAFVIIKRINNTGAWSMFDRAREGYNPENNNLFANSSDAESSNADQDLLSNGFKLRTSGAGRNGSGDTYIYMAFAEMPFKYSNAR